MIGYLYAIKAGNCVKLGYSSNPLSRLVKIQSDNHERCILIGVVEATQKQEAEVHTLLAPWKVTGEWFLADAGPVAALCSLLAPVAIKPSANVGSAGEVDSHADVIRVFGGPTLFAEALAIPVPSAGAMFNRRSIAAWHWPKVVRLAAELGRSDITVEKLASLVAKRGSAASSRQIEQV